MINIAICEDNEDFLKYVNNMILIFSKSHNISVNVSIFSDGLYLIEEYKNNISYDLIFLDIEMSQINGIDTALFIRKNDYNALLVYVSSYDNYLKELFQVEPFRFIQKPVNEQHFYEVLELAINRIKERNSQFFFFQSGKNIHKILYKDILYFESNARKVIIHTNTLDYEYYDKLNHIESELSKDGFIRIHKAYLVNVSNIENFQYERLAMCDGTILSISEKNRPKVRTAFWNYCKGATK